MQLLVGTVVTEIMLDTGYQREASATGKDVCSLSGPWTSLSLSGRRLSTYLEEQRYCRRQKPHAHTSTMADTSAKIVESDKWEQGV